MTVVGRISLLSNRHMKRRNKEVKNLPSALMRLIASLGSSAMMMRRQRVVNPKMSPIYMLEGAASSKIACENPLSDSKLFCDNGKVQQLQALHWNTLLAAQRREDSDPGEHICTEKWFWKCPSDLYTRDKKPLIIFQNPLVFSTGRLGPRRSGEHISTEKWFWKCSSDLYTQDKKPLIIFQNPLVFST